jgi:ferric-dicitrate binding protein FerR (iron transport regulator)
MHWTPGTLGRLLLARREEIGVPMLDDDFPADRLLHRRSLLGAALASFGLVIAGDAKAESAQRAGAVESVKGEAFAEASAARRVLDRNAPVFLGDQCGTGAESRLSMQLGGNTRLRLGEKARITIDRYLVSAGGELTLQSGPMLFDRAAGAAPTAIQIRTPFGLIAVRGTRFFAGPSRAVFGVFVERGTVTVTAGLGTVTLHAGEGTDIRYPGDAPSPPSRWGPPRIREALATVS